MGSGVIGQEFILATRICNIMLVASALRTEARKVRSATRPATAPEANAALLTQFSFQIGRGYFLSGGSRSASQAPGRSATWARTTAGMRRRRPMRPRFAGRTGGWESNPTSPDNWPWDDLMASNMPKKLRIRRHADGTIINRVLNFLIIQAYQQVDARGGQRSRNPWPFGSKGIDRR